MPNLNEFEICAFYKFCKSFNESSLFFSFNQKNSKILKLLVYGNNDPLIHLNDLEGTLNYYLDNWR